MGSVSSERDGQKLPAPRFLWEDAMAAKPTVSDEKTQEIVPRIDYSEALTITATPDDVVAARASCLRAFRSGSSRTTPGTIGP